MKTLTARMIQWKKELKETARLVKIADAEEAKLVSQIPILADHIGKEKSIAENHKIAVERLNDLADFVNELQNKL